MTEQEMQDALVDYIDATLEDFDHHFTDVRVHTFDERGINPYNRGLVLTLPSGEEFQLTIVKSADARS